MTHDLGWMIGAWSGFINADPVFETWSPPHNGTMIGTFRWERGGVTRLYEFILIELNTGPVIMKLRHFGADFRAWEDAYTPARFALQSSSAGHAVWRELGEPLPSTLHYKLSGSELEVWFEREGAPPPVSGRFVFSRLF